MEESKLPEEFESQLLDIHLKQCEYLFSKHINSSNIITLGPQRLIIKNNNNIACIQTDNNENVMTVTLIYNQQKKSLTKFKNYFSLIKFVIESI